MIVLDTNVVSELMRSSPNPTVEAWLDRQSAASLFLSAISEAELRYGVAVMPEGKRRDAIATEIERTLTRDFAGRILPFDSDAARAYASISADRRAAGQPGSQLDCQIAAIAHSRGAAVATRNVSDFEGCGIAVIDPWRS